MIYKGFSTWVVTTCCNILNFIIEIALSSEYVGIFWNILDDIRILV